MRSCNSTNVDLRFLIESNNLRHWQVAHKIGVTPNTLSNWLCSEMDPVRRLRIEKAVNELIEERERKVNEGDRNLLQRV